MSTISIGIPHMVGLLARIQPQHPLWLPIRFEGKINIRSMTYIQGQTLCPAELTETWEYATSYGLVPDEDANLRCSDCTLYPSQPECGRQTISNLTFLPLYHLLTTY
jgi:hypothetical protein